ncbi:MAG: hypothetical protein MI807_21085 [Verrucomicrobiales bacterium]|nr:hypothetical protein [Verrucomicrobiales bacterium]
MGTFPLMANAEIDSAIGPDEIAGVLVLESTEINGISKEGELLKTNYEETKVRNRRVLAHMGYLYIGFLLVLFLCERRASLEGNRRHELQLVEKPQS